MSANDPNRTSLNEAPPRDRESTEKEWRIQRCFYEY